MNEKGILELIREYEDKIHYNGIFIERLQDDVDFIYGEVKDCNVCDLQLLLGNVIKNRF